MAWIRHQRCLLVPFAVMLDGSICTLHGPDDANWHGLLVPFAM